MFPDFEWSDFRSPLYGVDLNTRLESTRRRERFLGKWERDLKCKKCHLPNVHVHDELDRLTT